MTEGVRKTPVEFRFPTEIPDSPFISFKGLLRDGLSWSQEMTDASAARIFQLNNKYDLADFLENEMGLTEKQADVEAEKIMQIKADSRGVSLENFKKYLFGHTIGLPKEIVAKHADALYAASSYKELHALLRAFLPGASRMEIEDRARLIAMDRGLDKDVDLPKFVEENGMEKFVIPPVVEEDKELWFNFDHPDDEITPREEERVSDLEDLTNFENDDDPFSAPTALPRTSSKSTATLNLPDRLPDIFLSKSKEGDVFGKELEQDMRALHDEERAKDIEKSKAEEVTVAMSADQATRSCQKENLKTR
jgi:hypothetical protein